MKGSATVATSGVSAGLPEILSGIPAALSRAPGRSKEKYRWRKLARGGSAKRSEFCVYQALSSASPGSCKAAISAARKSIFCANRRLMISSSLSSPKRHGFTGENLLAYPLLDQGVHLISRPQWPTLREPLHRQLAEIVLCERDLIC